MENIKNIVLRAFFLVFLALVSAGAFAQTKVSGVVKDTKGMPVIGAVVVLEGNSSVGASTDMDGRYTVTIPAGARQPKLTASCIGFASKTVEVGQRAVIDFEISDDAELLDEVVVVGYGAMRKSDLTGSVASVKIDDGEATRSSSLSSLLQGRAAGVQVINASGAPDAGISVRIRGVSSFNGTSEPLYVVDGIIINAQSGSETLLTQGLDNSDAEESTNGLMGINPQDIQSIEILKDASATAIYGALGANGVVLITTKTGTREKPVVNFSAGVDVSTNYKKMDVMSLEEYAQFFKDVNASYIAQYGKPYDYAVEQLNRMYADSEYTQFKVQGKDWQDEVMRTAVSQRYYFAISGRPKDLAYAFSLGYQNRQGIVKETGVKLYTARLNLDKTVNKKFKFGTKFNFSYTNSDMTTGTGSGRMTANSSLIRSITQYRPYFPEGYDVDEEESEEELKASPDKWLKKTDYFNSRREYRITPSIYAQYQFLPWLSFKSTLGGDYRNSERQMFKSNRISNDSYGSNAASATSEYFRWNWDNMFNLNKKFGAHRLQGTVGATANCSSSTEQNVQGWQIEQYKAGIEAINAASESSRGYAESTQTTMSFLARGIYNYKDRYVLTATYRIDGSSKFQGSNKWSGFPSAAFAWRASEEPWFKVPVFSMLKARIGWGRTGNQSISNYQTLNNYSGTKVPAHNTGNAANYLIGLYPSNLANPNLKWETTEQVNAGLDLGMWKGRLSLSVDAYNKMTYDLLQYKSIATSSGFSTLAINQGNIQNRGIELSLNATPLKIGDFEWSIDGNISLNRNKIITISEDAAKKTIFLNTNKETADVVYFEGSSVGTSNYINQTANIYMEGYPMGLFYGYKTKGIVDEGCEGVAMSNGGAKGTAGQLDYYDLNGNGYLDLDDRCIIGDPNPDFTYGFGTSFHFKGISLSANFNGSYGNDILNANLARLIQTNGSSTHNMLREAYYDAWTPTNKTAKYPAIRLGRTEDYKIFSDLFVEDGSYLRLANVSLSYDVPISKKSKVLKGLSFGANAQNLFVWTKYSGWDPDVNSYGSNVKKMGIDNGAYPSARTFSFDVKFRF